MKQRWDGKQKDSKTFVVDKLDKIVFFGKRKRALIRFQSEVMNVTG